MYIRGDTFKAMEAATGVPKSVAERIVKKAGADYVKQRYGDRTAALGRELAILDTLTRANLRAAMNGDRNAAAIILEARRAARRLLGLDAAVKAEVTVKTAQDIEIERLVALMKSEPDVASDTIQEAALGDLRV